MPPMSWNNERNPAISNAAPATTDSSGIRVVARTIALPQLRREPAEGEGEWRDRPQQRAQARRRREIRVQPVRQAGDEHGPEGKRGVAEIQCRPVAQHAHQRQQQFGKLHCGNGGLEPGWANEITQGHFQGCPGDQQPDHAAGGQVPEYQDRRRSDRKQRQWEPEPQWGASTAQTADSAKPPQTDTRIGRAAISFDEATEGSAGSPHRHRSTKTLPKP